MICLIAILFVLSIGAAQKSTRQTSEWDFKAEGEILMYNKCYYLPLKAFEMLIAANVSYIVKHL